jgi:hypothetical protein
MAKFSSASKSPAKTVSRAVLQTNGTIPDATTHEGGSAYTRDSRSELFLLGVSNFVGEDTFYESAADRDERFAALSREVAVNDPEWFAKFVGWLRAEGNMRSAPLVAVAEGVKARLDALKANPDAKFVGPSNREMVASVLKRADEPGELIGYWQGKYGQGLKAQLPKPIKRGIADAVTGSVQRKPLYSQYSALKYDTESRSPRFGDVLNLVHPDAREGDARQEQLFTWLLDRRFGRTEGKAYDLLDMVNTRATLQAVPQEDRKKFLADNDVSEVLSKAGVTWEWLASWLGSKLDAPFWEAVIPNMGYMATIRNLRNFDQAGVSDAVSEQVAAQIADPDQVAQSRQLPFRFLSAYNASSSDNYSLALSKALDLSVGNIPELPGRTLILIDTSASMNAHPSEKSKISMKEIAALFGLSLAKKSEDVAVFGFGDEPYAHPVGRGFSVLKETRKFLDRGAAGGHGTAVAYSLKKVWKGQDRVIILSDEQTVENVRGWMADRIGTVDSAVPEHVKVYGFNLEGYAPSMLPSKKNRVQLGGITDHTFRQIQLLEKGLAGTWPWEDEK